MDDTQKENRLEVVDGVLCYTISFPVGDAEALRLREMGERALGEIGASYVLINLEGSSEFSVGARKIWVDFLRNDLIKKAAIYGGGTLIRVIATFVITASGRDDVKFFSDEVSAREWLK